MSTILNISHVTKYKYDEPVSYGLQRLRLRPRDGVTQEVLSWKTEISGAKVESNYLDQFGNKVELASIEPDATEITVHASGSIETSNTNGVVGPHRGYVPLWLYKRETALTKPGKLIREIARSSAGDDDIERLHALVALVRERIVFRPGATDAETTAERALEEGSGVCQDHTHVFLSAARSLGFPARYVSGYLMMNDRVEQDASHAWAEAHIDNLGWVGFDAANGYCSDERYVRVAIGLDYRDAAPISGIRAGNSSETLAVSISVEQ